ncbi:hypothetical protein QCA50_011676 [Cerrena zonata]|uniref:Uncharacterized protein n=1 Tax=Cerrena zonata TaxID=2478898 RepID=A0AAW0FUN4_9APHY
MSSDDPIPAPNDEPAQAASVWDQKPIVPDDPSPQLRTVLHFIQGLQNHDYSFVATTLSEDFLMCILPQSLGVPCRPREEWLEKCRRSSLVWPKTFRLDILDINESPGKVWVHGIGTARAKTGKSYENEMLMMFKLSNGTESPDGLPKVLELKEFMDSLYISNWAAEVGKTLNQIK